MLAGATDDRRLSELLVKVTEPVVVNSSCRTPAEDSVSIRRISASGRPGSARTSPARPAPGWRVQASRASPTSRRTSRSMSSGRPAARVASMSSRLMTRSRVGSASMLPAAWQAPAPGRADRADRHTEGLRDIGVVGPFTNTTTRSSARQRSGRPDTCCHSRAWSSLSTAASAGSSADRGAVAFGLGRLVGDGQALLSPGQSPGLAADGGNQPGQHRAGVLDRVGVLDQAHPGQLDRVLGCGVVEALAACGVPQDRGQQVDEVTHAFAISGLVCRERPGDRSARLSPGALVISPHRRCPTWGAGRGVRAARRVRTPRTHGRS